MFQVLSINSGSSSIKAALFGIEGQAQLRPILRARIESIGIAPHVSVVDAAGQALWRYQWPDGAQRGHASLMQALVQWLHRNCAGEIGAAGHRIVHGGMRFSRPCAVDEEVLSALEALVPLAPLHQPQGLAGIRALAEIRPTLPQFACFDTAFHHTMPASAARLAIPRALHDQGVRRYGFHGLSYQYIAQRLAEIAPEIARGRCVVAHLGNGASLCALDGGRSVDTTMGFSVLDGLVMGTRCGALDPGVVLHLQEALGMSLVQVRELLYEQSGLLGISGLSSDLRQLMASDSPCAREAIDAFIWRASRECAALIGSLRGIDGLVFTGGIGENDAGIRTRMCHSLGWLGLELDAAANAGGGPRISARGSKVAAWVLPTDEELLIAQQTSSMVWPGG